MSVVVVGSINQDIVARVARIPAPGETLLAESLVRSGGGKGANQAVGARRAGGADVAFVGAVGTDAAGETLRSALVTDGIDVSGLLRVDGVTGTALISVDAHGENAIVVAAGANAARDTLTDTQRAAVASATVVLTQLEIPVALVRDAAAARADGAWHVLNAAPSAPFASARAELLAATDVLVVNEHEAREAAGADDLDEAVGALAAAVGVLVVTLGARGCLVVCGTDRAEVPAYAVTPVDTTGAGDTFCGVLAAALAASGRRPDTVDLDLLVDAARAGAAASALAVTRPGAQDAVPTSDEVVAFQKENQP
ncbi:ribokinase [Microbacterium oleivorans]|uniref:Ribokinase n=1 Tax=Microbacterium oleivorans TaxID=273677 RepID=A0A7D5EWC9_9MICO|nr:ribokinase [Microbacterium oleivorans]QLD11951.1 ribokinase [Microbacterium oleivorans]